MRFFFLFVGLLVCTQFDLYAQDISIQTSEILNGGTSPELLNYGDDFAVIELPPDHISSSSSRRIGDIQYFAVHRFNDALENTDSYELAWQERRENLGVFSLGENLLWLFKAQEKKKDSISINAQLIDKDGNLQEIMVLSKYSPELYVSIKVTSKPSPDNSKVLFTILKKRLGLTKTLFKEQDYPNDLSFLVFSKSGKLLTTLDENVTINTENFLLQSCYLDNNGNGYIAGKKSIRKTGKLINLLNLDTLEVYRFQTQGSEISKINIEPKDIAVDDVTFISSSTDTPSLFGTYGASSTEQGKVNGTFFLRDLTKSQSLELMPFSDQQLDLLNKGAIIRRHKDKSLPAHYHEIHGSRLNPGGSASVLLEGYVLIDNSPKNPQSKNIKPLKNTQIDRDPGNLFSSDDGPNSPQTFITSETSTSTTILTGRNSFKEDYPSLHMFYEGIILELTSDGVLTKPALIPKIQRSKFVAEKWSRMQLIPYEGNSVVLYNEMPKNLERELDKPPKAVKKPEDAVAVIGYQDQSGNIIRRKLVGPSAPEGMIILPGSGVALPSGEVAYLAQPVASSDGLDYIIVKIK